jgi:DNA-binding response OmpR family regulator
MNHSTPGLLPHGLRPPTVPVGRTIENPENHRAVAARILVIDDEREIRDIVTGLLRGAGYQVDTANDGAAGWAALCANPYDLLITDHMMPKVTGLELLRQVRAVPLTLPCLLISGQPPWDEDDLASLVQPGAVVPKPFGLMDLLAKTRDLLSGDPARQSIAAATPP